MPISPKNKMIYGLVACAVAAFVTDRLTRAPDPSTALASPSQLLVPASERAVANSNASSSAYTSPTVAELLRATARKAGWKRSDPATARNPFANAGPNARGGNDRPRMTAERFEQSHHLTAIVFAAVNSSRESKVMVDGQILTVGKFVDGFALMTVTRRSATFQCGDAQAVLTLPGIWPAPDIATKRMLSVTPWTIPKVNSAADTTD